MSEIMVSEILKRQTELAWEYLEKAKPLITYTKLVPVCEDQIAYYEQLLNKTVPTDYRYWLKTYGSGRIEFLESHLEILSIYELLNYSPLDERLVTDDDPEGCSKRVYLGYPGAPVALALDHTIIDEHGCAPVIQTHEYGNTVETVLASSWPMYVVRRIIDIASSLNNKIQNNSFADEQAKAINELVNQDIPFIDRALGMASERASAHNKTKMNGPDIVATNEKLQNSVLDFLAEVVKTRKSSNLIPRLMSGLTEFFDKDDAFTKILEQLDEQIEKGYASLYDDGFFSYDVEPRHAKVVEALLNHERRDLRKFAERWWLRINPGEAQKQAARFKE